MALIGKWRARSLVLAIACCLGMGLTAAAAPPVVWQKVQDGEFSGNPREWRPDEPRLLDPRVSYRSAGPVSSAVLLFARTVEHGSSSFSGGLRTAEGTADLTFFGRFEDGYPRQWQVVVKNSQGQTLASRWFPDLPNHGVTLALRERDKDPSRLWISTLNKQVNCLASPQAQFVQLEGENVTVKLKEPAKGAVLSLTAPFGPAGPSRAAPGRHWGVTIATAVALAVALYLAIYQLRSHRRREFKTPPPRTELTVTASTRAQPAKQQPVAMAPPSPAQPAKPGTAVGIVQSLERLEQTVQEMTRALGKVSNDQQSLANNSDILVEQVGKLREDVRKLGGTKKPLQDLRERLGRIEEMLGKRTLQAVESRRTVPGRPILSSEPAPPPSPEAARPAIEESPEVLPSVAREARSVAPRPSEEEPITEDDLLPSDR
jgi:hypothetical protein